MSDVDLARARELVKELNELLAEPAEKRRLERTEYEDRGAQTLMTDYDQYGAVIRTLLLPKMGRGMQTTDSEAALEQEAQKLGGEEGS